MSESLPAQRPRIGVSACLLGQKVRFDGGHKRSRFCTDQLSDYVDWVPVCPEVEAGLGTPRETIRLVQGDDRIELRTTRSDKDLTDLMEKFARRRVEALATQQLDGFVLKRDSPSCGMESVKIYQQRGPARRKGRGIFARFLLDRFPHLPIEEEGRLSDPRLRDNWVERIFAYHHLQQLFRQSWDVGDLVNFHTKYKFALLAHCEQRYRDLGRLVANANTFPRQHVQQRYASGFMEALKCIVTTRRHSNVLQHMFGFLKRELDSPERHDLLEQIEDYRQGLVPLTVPLALIRHYIQKLNIAYLQNQTYLTPHPKHLALRNYV